MQTIEWMGKYVIPEFDELEKLGDGYASRVHDHLVIGSGPRPVGR